MARSLSVLSLSAALIALLAGAAIVAAPPPAVDRAFEAFWAARNVEEGQSAAGGVIKSGVTFDEAFARLRRGRTYAAGVPRGVVRGSHRIGGTEFMYTLDVPERYDAAKTYQVRVQLHGGVMRTEGVPRGNGSIGALAGVEQIYVLPNSWRDALWWSNVQLDNVRAILDTVKRTYNVDENHIALAGVSDGATAAYYFAMRDPTMFSSFLLLNGTLLVLTNNANGIQDDLFPQNLVNKPFFVVNGARDQLYPAALVEPYLDHLKRGGVEVVYHMKPDGVHNTAWWPEERDSFEAFIRDHPRAPYPDKLTWQTDLSDSTSRAHWLIVDKLAPVRDRTRQLRDVNEFSTPTLMNFGARVTGPRITSVVPGSNADTFGLRPGDVVVSVNDKPVPGDADLLKVLATAPPRTRLRLGVSRDSKPIELAAVFVPGPGARTSPLFINDNPSGRVDVVRDGNTIAVDTSGVGEITLLVSPDVFDFSRPIKVIADGNTVFDRRVSKDLATLLKWAAVDNDRTMLFGAEVRVKVAPESKGL